MTKAEQYVLQQIAAGEIANLAEEFPEESDRILRACFVRLLLTNPGGRLSIHRHGINIKNAVICGTLDLNNDEIPYDVALDDSTFMDNVDLTQSHFVRSLSVAKSVFFGEVDFDKATIDLDLTTSECSFGKFVFFGKVHVGGDWLMQKANFTKEVNLSSAAVEGNLTADQATFHGGAYFSNVKVKADGRWPNANFDGPAYFSDAYFAGDLIADGTTFQQFVDFGSVTVEGDGSLRSAKLNKAVSFSGARFTNLYLDKAQFEDEADFTRTRMDTGFLDGTDFHKQPTIENMAFQYISPASWEKLQVLANGPAYNPEFYSSLEALFRRHGHPDEADAVFIAQKRREREKNLTGLYKFWSALQDWLVGYGRHLEKLLLWSAVFVVVGYIVFRREAGMKTKKPDDAQRYANQYSAFWYTVDLFLPVLSLGDSEIWTPKDERQWANLYKRVHIILGHLLVPIGLAAWAGIIK